MRTNMRRKLTWLLLLCAAMVFSQAVQAQSWQALSGAQSRDKAVQALAFLPNEIWIHAGESITWTFSSDEPHSVTFLKRGQLRPTYQTGCLPVPTPDGSPFDGSTCVNSGRITTFGTTYTVAFPTPGNYPVVCLIHANMTGTVHVLAPSQPLPHDQDFYNDQAANQQRDLLSDRDGGLERKFREDPPERGGANAHAHNHEIVTGSGELVATPGGAQSVSLMRFMRPNITIHAGETVEWASSDVSGHTITFGVEPPNVSPSTPPSASANVVLALDADGALHATITSPTDSVHSGRIAPASQERTGLAQLPPGATRFRVTFTSPGTYPYICAFHDELGMKGQVTVLP